MRSRPAPTGQGPVGRHFLRAKRAGRAPLAFQASSARRAERGGARGSRADRGPSAGATVWHWQVGRARPFAALKKVALRSRTWHPGRFAPRRRSTGIGSRACPTSSDVGTGDPSITGPSPGGSESPCPRPVFRPLKRSGTHTFRGSHADQRGRIDPTAWTHDPALGRTPRLTPPARAAAPASCPSRRACRRWGRRGSRASGSRCARRPGPRASRHRTGPSASPCRGPRW